MPLLRTEPENIITMSTKILRESCSSKLFIGKTMRTNLNVGFGNINYVTTMKWNTNATVKEDV